MVMSALQQLHEDYRAPLSLYYMEQVSYNEIAEILGIPLGTVRSRIARAKAALFHRLQKDEGRHG
jgi:RNA polymerase sigma-70 factor (ECF subfamily)